MSHKRKFHKSQKTKELEKQTNHGFSEHKDLKELHDFFTTDPDSVPGSRFEPPMFNKPSRTEMARSQGKIK